MSIFTLLIVVLIKEIYSSQSIASDSAHVKMNISKYLKQASELKFSSSDYQKGLNSVI